MKTALLASAALLSVLPLAGCRIDKSQGKDDVRISTPFGNMQVKTDADVVQDGIGVAVYPGAHLEKKKDSRADPLPPAAPSRPFFPARWRRLGYGVIRVVLPPERS